eukprot:2231185-Pyramimonas_sp.AAC.1
MHNAIERSGAARSPRGQRCGATRLALDSSSQCCLGLGLSLFPEWCTKRGRPGKTLRLGRGLD